MYQKIHFSQNYHHLSHDNLCEASEQPVERIYQDKRYGETTPETAEH